MAANDQAKRCQGIYKNDIDFIFHGIFHCQHRTGQLEMGVDINKPVEQQFWFSAFTVKPTEDCM